MVTEHAQKKTTTVVESLSTNTTRCTVPENTSLLQDLINSMRNLHQMYSDDLCAAQEAEKEEVMEPSHSQTGYYTCKQAHGNELLPSMEASRQSAN